MGAAPHQRLTPRLLKQARSHRWLILATLLTSLVAAPLTLLLPLPLKIAVDCALGSRPLPRALGFLVHGHQTYFNSLVVAACLLILTTLLSYGQGLAVWILATYTGEKLLLDFRSLLFRHAQRLSLAYHDSRGTSDSIYRIQYDAPSMQDLLVNGVMPLLTSAVTIGGMIYITARLDPELSLIALAVCPLLYWLMHRFGSSVRSQWEEFKRFDSSVMSVVQEVLSAVRIVKAFGTEEREQERFRRESDERLRWQVRLSAWQGVFGLVIGLVLAIGTAAVLLVGVGHVHSGKMTLGALLLIMAYLAQLYEPLKTLSTKITDIQSSFVSAARAFAILDEVPEVAEKPHARALARCAGVIEFHGVSFGYGDRGSVLRNISFEAPAGTRIGIAGRTGAGKTTLLNLLMRFYDPQQGTILLDGIDLREYKLSDLRNQFGLVLQDPVLFSSTIAENIAYACPSASHETIIAAAKAAKAHDFILGLPQGYQTPVGERGMLLSGGERQRISVARAFLKNAPVLLLDEPTSSVDVATETEMMDSLERLMQGRTVFMVAHRLSTLDLCDLRIEIAEGDAIHIAGRVNSAR